MLGYREILRLAAMGISMRNVVFSVGFAISMAADRDVSRDYGVHWLEAGGWVCRQTGCLLLSREGI